MLWMNETMLPSRSAVAMSIYSGIYNLGIGSGSYLGGLICTHASIAYIGWGGYKTLWTERYGLLPDNDGERYHGEQIV